MTNRNSSGRKQRTSALGFVRKMILGSVAMGLAILLLAELSQAARIVLVIGTTMALVVSFPSRLALRRGSPGAALWQPIGRHCGVSAVCSRRLALCSSCSPFWPHRSSALAWQSWDSLAFPCSPCIPSPRRMAFARASGGLVKTSV